MFHINDYIVGYPTNDIPEIPRLTKEDMNTTQQLSTVSPVHYNGPKRPTPPEQIIFSIRGIT